MGCGCGARSRAASRGQVIAGYRVRLPDGVLTPEGSTVVPPLNKGPFSSPGEARTAIREYEGGTAFTVYRSA